MINALETPAIFITSMGRTGTQFLGHKMSQMIDDCTSVHEPDVLWLDRPNEWYKKINEHGIIRMTLGRFKTCYSLRALNIARQSGNITDSQIIIYLKQLRIGILENLKSGIYLEANAQVRGLIDLLPSAFPNSRIVYIIRDPRFWVQSRMNMTISFYSRCDVMSWFKNSRLKPYHFEGDSYEKRWRKMSQFEKLCWAWSRETSYSLECIRKTDTVKVIRFEDLFHEKTRDETFTQMLQFITTFPNGFKANWQYKPALLSKKVHSTAKGKFPEWTKWSDDRVKQVYRHCRGLMEQFNYGIEPEWQDKIHS